jgi:hypothetical protein
MFAAAWLVQEYREGWAFTATTTTIAMGGQRGIDDHGRVLDPAGRHKGSDHEHGKSGCAGHFRRHR